MRKFNIISNVMEFLYRKMILLENSMLFIII